MNVYVRKNTSYYYPIIYVIKIIEKNRNIKFTLIDSVENAKIIWDDKNDNSEVIALDFYNSLSNNLSALNHEKLFSSSPKITCQNNNKDLIATIFYLINCLQEIQPNDEDLDELGRYKYSASCQSRFNIINENLVEKLIDEFCAKHSISGRKNDSVFFVSHDIDNIYGSLLEDGFWALKRMKIGAILNLIIFEITKNPHWRNIDRIIKINNTHDIKSTFFWLVNHGISKNGINNADYKLNEVRDLVDNIEKSNNVNGLHKSSYEMSIDEELIKGNLNTKCNRYHYLKFLPHKDWKKISNSSLNFDASLGFSEQCGFRNSYGKSFQPFDISENKPYDFIESPLHFMDRTFHKYMKTPTDQIGDIIIDMFEKNEKNCDFSLLWHNNYFTDYKYNSFIKEYKKIITFIYESKIQCVSPNELVEKNYLKW